MKLLLQILAAELAAPIFGVHMVHDKSIIATDPATTDTTATPSVDLESRCVHMLADLFNAPVSATTVGTSTTGSSEAAMLGGGLAAKRRWRFLTLPLGVQPDETGSEPLISAAKT